MMCQACNKKKATVHVTEIHDSVKSELHMCEVCAQQKGLSEKINFSIPELLGNMVESKMGKSLTREMTGLRCPRCGLTYKDFRNKARFGCPHDYEVFREGVRALVEKIHGASHHVGKVPAGTSKQISHDQEMRRLQRELEMSIQVEDFEKAAEVRDRINALTKSHHAEGKDESDGGE